MLEKFECQKSECIFLLTKFCFMHITMIFNTALGDLQTGMELLRFFNALY